jgi:hypothetical protein
MSQVYKFMGEEPKGGPFRTLGVVAVVQGSVLSEIEIAIVLAFFKERQWSN